MDILALVITRFHFLLKFYDAATHRFVAEMKEIESIDPPGEGDEEPYGQAEWSFCHDSLDVLGQHCVGMLAASLKLYLGGYMSRMNEFFQLNSKYERKKGEGWFLGYKRHFLEQFKIDWEKSPIRFGILEQVILSRNDFEHGTEFFGTAVYQNDAHFKKYKTSFFADPMEMDIYKAEHVDREDEEPYFPWRLNVTREPLFEAIDEAKKFCEWLEWVCDHYGDFLKKNTPDKK